MGGGGKGEDDPTTSRLKVLKCHILKFLEKYVFIISTVQKCRFILHNINSKISAFSGEQMRETLFRNYFFAF